MLRSDNTLVMVIDIQERLTPVLHDAVGLVAKSCQFLQGLNVLAVPMLVTEQYPKGLGTTVAEVKQVIENVPVFEKTQFSALTEEVQENLRFRQPENVILLGGETHVCVLQTALALREQGLAVYLAQECVSSRALENKINGLQQMQAAGVVISNIESILFQLLGDAKHPKFKEISKLIQ